MGLAMLLLAILARRMRSWPRAGLIVVSTMVPFLLAGLVVEAFEASWPDDFLLRLHAAVVAGWIAVAALGVDVALKLGIAAGCGDAAAEHRLGSVAVVVTVPIIDDLRATGSDGAGVAPLVSSAVANPGQPAGRHRDVYHLVFDRYGSDRSAGARTGHRQQRLHGLAT